MVKVYPTSTLLNFKKLLWGEWAFALSCGAKEGMPPCLHLSTVGRNMNIIAIVIYSILRLRSISFMSGTAEVLKARGVGDFAHTGCRGGHLCAGRKCAHGDRTQRLRGKHAAYQTDNKIHHRSKKVLKIPIKWSREAKLVTR